MPLIQTVYQTGQVFHNLINEWNFSVYNPKMQLWLNFLTNDLFDCFVRNFSSITSLPFYLYNEYWWKYSASNQNRAIVLLSEKLPPPLQYIDWWVLLEIGKPCLISYSSSLRASIAVHRWLTVHWTESPFLSLKSEGPIQGHGIPAQLLQVFELHVDIAEFCIGKSSFLCNLVQFGLFLYLSNEICPICHTFHSFDILGWILGRGSNVNIKYRIILR